MNKDTANPGQPITAELRVAAGDHAIAVSSMTRLVFSGLRWLAGGSWCESHGLGVSDSVFFTNKTAFVDLLNKHFQKEQLDLVSRLRCVDYLNSIEVSVLVSCRCLSIIFAGGICMPDTRHHAWLYRCIGWPNCED